MHLSQITAAIKNHFPKCKDVVFMGNDFYPYYRLSKSFGARKFVVEIDGIKVKVVGHMSGYSGGLRVPVSEAYNNGIFHFAYKVPKGVLVKEQS